MRERGGGRIVNVASSSIKQPLETLILSNTFRAGVAGLTKSLSFELAPDGILVNTLSHGRIYTERSTAIDASRAEALRVSVEAVRGQVEAQIPLGRYGTPEEFCQGCGVSGLPGEHRGSEVQDEPSYGFALC